MTPVKLIPVNLIRLRSQIIFEEGFRATKYRCSENHWTIGYGHNLEAKPTFNGKRIPDKVTKELAEAILTSDIDDAIAGCVKRITCFKNLDDARKASLVNMVFQMGIEGVLAFNTTLKLLNEGDFEAAGVQVLKSLWAKQTPGRAKRVASQLSSGVFYKLER